jgi:hypothetical protein
VSEYQYGWWSGTNSDKLPAEEVERLTRHDAWLDECVRLVRTLVEIYRWQIDHPPTEVRWEADVMRPWGDRLVFIERQGDKEINGKLDPSIFLDRDPLEILVMVMREMDKRAGRGPATDRVRRP